MFRVAISYISRNEACVPVVPIQLLITEIESKVGEPTLSTSELEIVSNLLNALEIELDKFRALSGGKASCLTYHEILDPLSGYHNVSMYLGTPPFRTHLAFRQ